MFNRVWGAELAKNFIKEMNVSQSKITKCKNVVTSITSKCIDASEAVPLSLIWLPFATGIVLFITFVIMAIICKKDKGNSKNENEESKNENEKSKSGKEKQNLNFACKAMSFIDLKIVRVYKSKKFKSAWFLMIVIGLLQAGLFSGFM